MKTYIPKELFKNSPLNNRNINNLFKKLREKSNSKPIYAVGYLKNKIPYRIHSPIKVKVEVFIDNEWKTTELKNILN
jgi:hypothetical protein